MVYLQHTVGHGIECLDSGFVGFRVGQRAPQAKNLSKIRLSYPWRNTRLAYKPYQDSHRPNQKLPKLLYHGKVSVCHLLFIFTGGTYIVRRANDTREVSVHLAHVKPYHRPETPPAPQVEKLADSFFGILRRLAGRVALCFTLYYTRKRVLAQSNNQSHGGAERNKYKIQKETRQSLGRVALAW